MSTPAYVVQHTYLGEGPTRMHHRRAGLTMANRIEDSPRETDCSGRALATLVIAWVGAALVASVLLKWTHMWVALAVLTLLFLVACGYAAYDARRTQERAFARETSRQQERRRRREQQLESVSGGIDNFPEIIDPPEYQTYWVADLPPSYTTAVGTQPGNVSATTTPDPEDIAPPIRPPRLSNPPPYALAVQTEPLFIPIMQNGIQNVDNTTLQLQGVPVAGQNMILQTSIENGHTSSHNGRIPPAIPPAIRDQDKVEEGGENGQNTLTCTAPPPTRTQYLTSILSSTFGRNMRRANNNQEQNSNPVGFQTNRDETVVNCSSNNDRNNNNNNIGAGPPPPYPVTRLSTD